MCHVARHAFATTITLQEGVPIEAISEHYADKAQIVINNAQILGSIPPIKQLTSEKKTRSNNSPIMLFH
jgi:hypothetical protein